MRRERALKVVLVLVGLFFSAGIYPVMDSPRHADQSMYTDDMMLSLYVALGIFLLIAVRNPSANRSLIAFTAWSSFAHAAVMAVMAFQNASHRGDLWGVAALVIIGVALIGLAPAKHSVERISAAVASARIQERHAHPLRRPRIHISPSRFLALLTALTTGPAMNKGVLFKSACLG